MFNFALAFNCFLNVFQCPSSLIYFLIASVVEDVPASSFRLIESQILRQQLLLCCMYSPVGLPLWILLASRLGSRRCPVCSCCKNWAPQEYISPFLGGTSEL